MFGVGSCQGNGKKCRQRRFITKITIRNGTKERAHPSPYTNMKMRMKPPGEYSRYLRRQAERYAEARGYDARLLRYARQRDCMTLFPVDGKGVAVAIDDDGCASLVPFLDKKQA